MAAYPTDTAPVTGSPEADRQDTYLQAGNSLEQIMQLGFEELDTHIAMSDTLDDALERSRRYQRLADFLRLQAGTLDAAASTVRHTITRISEAAATDVDDRQTAKSPGGVISGYPDLDLGESRIR